MATINVGIKISAAVSAANATTATSGTLYTCPANSYAIVQLRAIAFAASTTCAISVGGNVTLTANNSTNNSSYNNGGSASDADLVMTGVIVGPGQSVTFSKSANVQAAAYVTGVQFVNTQ